MSDDKVIFEELRCRDRHRIGVITLNNPKALNALSIDMVDTIYDQLAKWSTNDKIACVLITGAGGKAFCAGGDIQAIYYAMKENPGKACAEGENFFTREYRLDYTIHTYPKPVITWGHGIVMGGGLGVFIGGDFRVVTETSRVAMPEITIALFPDVGASYFLNKMPGKCGRFLGLTGASINASDCLYLGLADRFIENRHYKEVLSILQDQTWAGEKSEDAEIIDELLASFADQSGEKLPQNNVEAHRDIIDELFSGENIREVITGFTNYKTNDEWLQKAQQTLSAGSPLHALIIDKQLSSSEALGLREVFQSELVLASNILRFTEFTEGIRALLIDKDRNPSWHYSSCDDVPDDFVDSFFVPPWETNPLSSLEEV